MLHYYILKIISSPKLGSIKDYGKVPFFFFCGGWGLNPRPCIYYVLSIQTELSSRGLKFLHLNKIMGY